MQSTQNRDRRRGSQHYHYADVDGHGSGSGSGSAPQLPQHQAIEPGPPVANNASFRRGVSAAMSGDVQRSVPREELLNNKTDEALKQRQAHTQPQQQQQQLQQQQPLSRRRGYRRTDESGDLSPTAPDGRTESSSASGSGSGSGPAQSNSASYKQSHSQPQPLPNTRSRADPVPVSVPAPVQPSRGSPRSSAQQQKVQRGAEGGQMIPRVNSPSVMSSVLQPLNGKIQEYDTQMSDAQSLMDQLDAETAILLQRRREAEKQFLAAKTKHDDYRRQYQGVERAMRGEPDMSFSRLSVGSERPSTQHTVQANVAGQPPRAPQDGMRSRTESWNSLHGNGENPKRESRGFKLRNLFG